MTTLAPANSLEDIQQKLANGALIEAGVHHRGSLA